MRKGIAALVPVLLLSHFVLAQPQNEMEKSDRLFFKSLVASKDQRELILEQAKDALKKAEAERAKPAEIYARLARIDGQIALYKSGKEKIRMAHAIKENAERALALDSDNAIANLVLGVWYYELAGVNGLERIFAKIFYGEVPQGDYGTSLGYLEKAVRLRPDVVYFHLALGKTLAKLHKVSAAREELQKAIDLSVQEEIDLAYKQEAEKLLNKLHTSQD